MRYGILSSVTTAAVILIAAAGLLFLAGTSAAADQGGSDRGVVTWGDAAADAAPEVVTEAVEGRRIRIGIVQGRRMGLTAVRLLPLLRELDARGELDDVKDLPRRERNHAIANLLAAEYVQVESELVESEGRAMGLTTERDWASFLQAFADFLERIMPLIMLLFGGL